MVASPCPAWPGWLLSPMPHLWNVKIPTLWGSHSWTDFGFGEGLLPPTPLVGQRQRLAGGGAEQVVQLGRGENLLQCVAHHSWADLHSGEAQGWDRGNVSWFRVSHS